MGYFKTFAKKSFIITSRSLNNQLYNKERVHFHIRRNLFRLSEKYIFRISSKKFKFPTIYGIALKGLRQDAKFGAAGLVMAILGGALMPMAHAAVMDAFGSSWGYIVPACCLTIVALYAAYDLRSDVPLRRVPAPTTKGGVVDA